MQSLSRVRLSATPWTTAYEVLHPWNFPGKNTGVGYHFLLWGIFPTQGSKPGLPHCKQTILPSEPPGKLIRNLRNNSWIHLKQHTPFHSPAIYIHLLGCDGFPTSSQFCPRDPRRLPLRTSLDQRPSVMRSGPSDQLCLSTLGRPEVPFIERIHNPRMGLKQTLCLT